MMARLLLRLVGIVVQFVFRRPAPTFEILIFEVGAVSYTAVSYIVTAGMWTPGLSSTLVGVRGGNISFSFGLWMYVKYRKNS